MKVPFFDLKEQTRRLKPDFMHAVEAVLEQTAFAGGPFVREFEQAFAAYCGAEHAVGVGNGTDALWLALLGLGIGPGDEVITAANTFVATVEAIHFAGAKPVLIDIEEESYNMDPAQLEEAITPRTRAILPVHLYGQMANLAPILQIAADHKVPVVEDASQAHGAADGEHRAGCAGVAGCFSFYPGKNLGACGEAGAVICHDPELAERMRMFREHGQKAKYHHEIVGWNARMDGIQAALLSVKLRHIEAWTQRRREIATLYRSLLADLEGVLLPGERVGAQHVYHLYVIQTVERDRFREELEAHGVGTGIHYPIPIHQLPAFQYLGYAEGSFPVTERVCSRIVSLPMFPELSDDDVAYVCDQARAVLQNRPLAAV